MAITTVFSGCSLISPERDSLTDYASAKRAINNPVDVGNSEFGNGIYRPEGVSADKDGAADDLLEKIGLKKARRRNIDTARDLYARAEQRFNEAKSLEGESRAEAFRESAELYQEAAENWQSSGLEQDAVLMAAEALFFAEEYYHSEQMYAKLIKEYPRNPYLDHVDSRRFEIADYWLRIGTAEKKPFVYVNFTDPKEPWNDTGGHGKQLLERLRLDNPTGNISDDATMRLAMEHFQAQRFEEAANTFADLRMTYPDSEHQFNAQYLEMQSQLASYQGAKYSSMPLTEAEKRIKQIARQFPSEANEKRKELNEAYARVRFLQAERIWEQGVGYRRAQGENAAAKFHCQRILDEFSDTPFADEAEKLIQELADAPDSPPQRFQTLAWMLGGNTDDRPWLKESSGEQ